ncbi:soluble calcium-activated nucleotidase 1-like [Antedon mediterranea]|uniref:soluble calcium-activated nucleotidase 1-like n=1 Tax=Antedon mediterranea TaxID=105859 RepID=UPI003AF65107
MNGDWSSVRSPSVRYPNQRFRVRPRLVAVIAMVMFFILILLLMPESKSRTGGSFDMRNRLIFAPSTMYNGSYPGSIPVKTVGGKKYKIGLVADLDTDSKDKENPKIWNSYLKTGYLTLNGHHDGLTIEWEDNRLLTSQFSQGGRGMELSELIIFNGKTYTVDDRTGVVYEIIDNRVVTWVILPDGDGTASKGFKAEWMAVKDQHLYIGGLGKEWTTTTGELVNLNPQWVKVISHLGEVKHIQWSKNYNAMRKSAGYEYPGYMIHESGVWSEHHQQWFFLPRRASTLRYDEVEDEHRATNILLRCSADFEQVTVTRIGTLNAIRGYSSFKFIPGTRDQIIVALKTEENHGEIATFITAFNIKGVIIYKDEKIADNKFEGIEFI